MLEPPHYYSQGVIEEFLWRNKCVYRNLDHEKICKIFRLQMKPEKSKFEISSIKESGFCVGPDALASVVLKVEIIFLENVSKRKMEYLGFEIFF